MQTLSEIEMRDRTSRDALAEDAIFEQKYQRTCVFLIGPIDGRCENRRQAYMLCISNVGRRKT